MTRIVFVLCAVLAGACSPPRPDPAVLQAQAATAEAWRAWNAEQSLMMTVRSLQINPYVAPEVRADPWACARAIEASGGMFFGTGPLPRCYADAIVRQQAGTVTVVPVFPYHP